MPIEASSLLAGLAESPTSRPPPRTPAQPWLLLCRRTPWSFPSSALSFLSGAASLCPGPDHLPLSPAGVSHPFLCSRRWLLCTTAPVSGPILASTLDSVQEPWVLPLNSQNVECLPQVLIPLVFSLLTAKCIGRNRSSNEERRHFMSCIIFLLIGSSPE